MTLFSQRRAAAIGSAVALVALAACGSDDGGGGSSGDKPLAGLITKTDTNPFFVKMKEGAQSAASEQGIELQSFAGKQDGDNEAQVQAIESLISAGAAGFLITPSDSAAIVPSIDQAKQQDMLVIALDTATEPEDAVDATFATDNFQAGVLIGEWAKAKFAGEPANIAMLDLNANQVSVDVQRDQGFLKGFGIDVKDETTIGDEDDPQIVGHAATDGEAAGGRTAMETLLQKEPDIDLVYTINEPAAAGAYEALKSAGKDKDVTLVSVDGSCPGVENVKSGVIGATSMQFPLKMAKLGVEALAKFAEDGTKPEAGFTDTGVELIAEQAQEGVPSKDAAWGLDNCWG